jgi:hypothetical protein
MVVLLLALVAAGVVGGYIAKSVGEARLTSMALDGRKASVAAEAGLEYGVRKLADVLLQYRLSPYVGTDELQALIDTIPAPAPIPPYVYRSPSGGPSFVIRVESPVIEGVIANGRMCIGSTGTVQMFSVTCGAVNPGTGVGVVLKQTVQAVKGCPANSAPGAEQVCGMEELLRTRTGWADL